MATQTFDKLNNLKQKSIPFDKYFDEMDLDDEEKERRKKLASELDPMFFYLLAMLFEDEDIEKAKQELAKQYTDIVSKFYKDDIKNEDDIYKYIQDISNEIIDTTVKNKADEWYFSQDRATYLAENETNSVANYYQERQAIIDGKTQKVWRTILDGKERHSHLLAHNQTVGIDEVFTVGKSYMRFPRDTYFDPEGKEIVNCRCSCLYI